MAIIVREGFDQTLTTETVAKIDSAIDRLVREIGAPDYETAFRSIPPVMLYSLVCQLGLQQNFPQQLESYESFMDHLQQMQNRDGFRELMIAGEEPSPESLQELLTKLKSFPSDFKRALTGTAAQIRPSGGPPEKLADPRSIQKIVDEIFDARKKGASLESAQTIIAKRENVSLKTVQRRYREEMKRRESRYADNAQATDKLI